MMPTTFASVFSRPRVFAAAIAAVMLAAPPAPAQDQALQVRVVDSIPKVRPDYPVPDEPNQLFYLQRSSDSNTVVYTARLVGPGEVDARRPVDIFWRRYRSSGQRGELGFLERRLGYGINFRRGRDGVYSGHIVGLPALSASLHFNGAGEPEAHMRMGGRQARLVYAYVEFVENAPVDTPRQVDIFGIDVATGEALHGRLRVR